MEPHFAHSHRSSAYSAGLHNPAWMIVYQDYTARADANQRTKHVAGGQCTTMCTTRGEHQLLEDVVSAVKRHGQHDFVSEISQACRVDRGHLVGAGKAPNG